MLDATASSTSATLLLIEARRRSNLSLGSVDSNEFFVSIRIRDIPFDLFSDCK